METDNQGGRGYLIVRVSTANGAIPLKGAGVTVREYKSPDIVVQSSVTDGDGNTVIFSLPAPLIANSQIPGMKAYSNYNISVSNNGYGSLYFYNVPVFPGITAVQQAYLVPLAEDGSQNMQNQSGDRHIYIEGFNAAL